MVRPAFRRILALLLLLYCIVSSPVVALLLLSKDFRTGTTEEISRKLTRFRRARYVFIGDSITAGAGNCGMEMGDSPFSAVNLGVSGYIVWQAGLRIPHASQFQPLWVLVMAGTNDIELGRTDEQILADFEILLRSAEVQGIPRLAVTSIPLRASSTLDSRILYLNARISDLTAKHERVFIDVNGDILRSADRNVFFIPDGLHFSPHGYRLWFDKLRAVIR